MHWKFTYTSVLKFQIFHISSYKQKRVWVYGIHLRMNYGSKLLMHMAKVFNRSGEGFMHAVKVRSHCRD